MASSRFPAQPQPRLRLVPSERVPSPRKGVIRASAGRMSHQRPDLAAFSAAAQIARENQAASLAWNDARWLLAFRVSTSLQGGRAAMLTPERRRDLMNLASDLNLRPFDGQLIIAIVQDAARRGEDTLSHAVQERVAMVSPAVRSAERGLSPTLALATSMALGLIGMGLMIFFTVR